MTVLRVSAGKGTHVTNLFAENTSLIASSRKWFIDEKLLPEQAWNYGLNFTTGFDVAGKAVTIDAEYYRTDFTNQVIVDLDQNPNEVHFYNLHGVSYSNSAQIDVKFEPVRRLEVTTAYRLNDVWMTFGNQLMRKPLSSPNKAFVNLAYATEFNEWSFDFTIDYNGSGRLPSTSLNPAQYQKPGTFPDFTLLHAQITKKFDFYEIYLGVENLLGFKINDAILSSNSPYGQYFDSSLIWGPIDGRKIYIGTRINLF